MRTKQKALVTAAVAALSLSAVSLVACGGGSDNNNPPPATKTTYSGTLYLAATTGGHVAVVPVTIDPSNASAPITVGSLSRIQLKNSTGTAAGMVAPPTGTNRTHIFHDVRLDATANRLYYTTIIPDSDLVNTANNGKAHVGYVDLASTGTPHDAVIDAAPAGTGMVYCGSGQTSTHLFPITMSHPAYIDAISKSAITNGASLASGSADVKRTMVSAFRTDTDYIFAHGVTSPNGQSLYVAVNNTNAGEGGTMAGMNGSWTTYLLKTSDVAGGTVSSSSVTATSTVANVPGSVAFRSTFTPDGTKILQAGANRFVVLNASDLSTLDNDTNIGGTYAANGGLENHDVMPTPDGKYAILALRFKYASGATNYQDSGVQLYDIANKKTIGNPVSTCNACHNPGSPGAVGDDRQTCGIDGKLTAVTQ